MENINEITVTVKYTVSLGDIENVPGAVYDELRDAFESCTTISPMSVRNEYQLAAEWISENIKEADCMDWECEIDDLD